MAPLKLFHFGTVVIRAVESLSFVMALPPEGVSVAGFYLCLWKSVNFVPVLTYSIYMSYCCFVNIVIDCDENRVEYNITSF